MKKTFLIIVLFTFLSSHSQKKHKVYYKYDGKEYLVEEGQLDKQNKRKGIWTKYYHDFSDPSEPVNNKIQSVTTYDKGVKNGLYKKFYPEGPIEIEGVYKDDKETGIWKSYYKEGKTRLIKNFNNDVAIFKFFDRNENLRQRVEYKNSTKMDEYYYANGQVSKSTIENLEKKTKAYKSFFEDGQLEEEGNYINGKKYGEWKLYYQNGKIKIVLLLGESKALNIKPTYIYFDFFVTKEGLWLSTNNPKNPAYNEDELHFELFSIH